MDVFVGRTLRMLKWQEIGQERVLTRKTFQGLWCAMRVDEFIGTRRMLVWTPTRACHHVRRPPQDDFSDRNRFRDLP